MLRLIPFMMLVVTSPFWAQDTWVLPHVPVDLESFDVRIVLENRLEQSRSFNLTAFDATGVELDTVTVELESTQQMSWSPSQLFVPGAATIFVSGGPLTGGLLTSDTLTGLVAGIHYQYAGRPETGAFVPALETNSKRWRVHAGNWEATFDGLILLNLDTCTGAGATLQHYNADGSLIRTIDIAPTRGAFFKTVINLAGQFDDAPGSYVDIVANTKLVVTALRGSLDRNTPTSFLLSNPAVPIPELEDQRRALEENRRRWQTSDVRQYTYTLRNACFCPDAITTPVRVSVTDNWITNLVYTTDETEVDVENRRFFQTIEDLFDVIEHALDAAPAFVGVTYDPQYGFPTEIIIDPDVCLVDEEAVYFTFDFTPAE